MTTQPPCANSLFYWSRNLRSRVLLPVDWKEYAPFSNSSRTWSHWICPCRIWMVCKQLVESADLVLLPESSS